MVAAICCSHWMTTSLAQKKPTRKELFPRLSARCGVVVRLRVCPREGNPASVTSLLTLAAALGAPLSLNELVDLAGMADLADFADAGDDCLSFAGDATVFSRWRAVPFCDLPAYSD